MATSQNTCKIATTALDRRFRMPTLSGIDQSRMLMCSTKHRGAEGRVGGVRRGILPGSEDVATRVHWFSGTAGELFSERAFGSVNSSWDRPHDSERTNEPGLFNEVQKLFSERPH